MARPERSHLEEHYADLAGRSFFAGLIDYMVSIRGSIGWLRAVVCHRSQITSARAAIGVWLRYNVIRGLNDARVRALVLLISPVDLLDVLLDLVLAFTEHETPYPVAAAS